ncbi:chemotaxis protein CheX [Roseateles oligotrophus]|uniref:Chemotaxis protein CheX n=1 Tax=Roseateles oligotrophus TaxID=1769250 RepID=A0ABT2YHR2_9BURK|nr:chemotaxis protein CheX [Roseateles oligotrophus]MCV2369563.1 chemotaxis protein CheX [Roseateles oligotrophus]
MTDASLLEAKVLLLEHDPEQYQVLTDFCRSIGLMALPRSASDALATLGKHKDLGGVLLAEDLPCDEGNALQLARAIHKLRPELPIFLRRSSDIELSAAEQAAVRHRWVSGDLTHLRAVIDHTIFSLSYPRSLVQGIADLTCASLMAMFPNAKVVAESPYVVHDRIIHGEVSTLIPIESTWCRGYMMLQTEENALRQGLIQGFSYEGVGGDLNFRELNNMLGETTNLIWGAFKNRYIPPQALSKQQTQVPIVINHAHKYISFGSEDSQLCVRYQLSDPARPGMPPLVIVQRVIFNLHWSAEEFADFEAHAVKAGPTGELDLF